MDVIKIVIFVFAVLSAIDWLIGNRLGIGKEFERAFSLFCPMALSMLGMIVIAPAIGVWLMPLFDDFYALCGIDPSIIPASLFANDMGGMPLAQSIAKSPTVGGFNAFVVSSMMGCVISFTIPFSLGLVKKEQHKELFFGLLCGIVTIPLGCFAAGLLCSLSPLEILVDLLPLLIISAILAAALIFLPAICIKCFKGFGLLMKVLAIAGLVLSVFTFLTKIEICPDFDTFENGALICANACVTLSGALPLMHLITKLLGKPLNKLGALIGVDGTSALAFLGTLVTNASTLGTMEKMCPRGVVLNAAFAVSASFVFGSHLAFTTAFDASYILPVTVGKLLSGVCAVILAAVLYREKNIVLQK